MKLPALTILEALVSMVIVGIALSIGIFFFSNYSASGDHGNALAARQLAQYYMSETIAEQDWSDAEWKRKALVCQREVTEVNDHLVRITIKLKNNKKQVFSTHKLVRID